MSAARKTAQISAILATANRLLAAPDGPYTGPEFRKGVAALLESTLHAANAYEGFNYLEWLETGHARWIADGEPHSAVMAEYLGDQTRRVYYGSRPESKPRKRGESAELSRDYPCALGTK